MKAETLPADIQNNREIARSIVEYYLENDKIIPARQYLAQHLAKDPKDIEGFKVFGLIQSRLGNCKGAAEAYDRAAKQLPLNKEKGKVLYLLADAQLKCGDTAAANATLEAIAVIPGFERSIDKSLAEAATKQALTSIEVESTAGLGTHPYKVNLGMAAGYDDNVFLLNDTRVARAAGQTPDSFFYKPTVQAQYGRLLMGEPLSFQGYAVYTNYLTSGAKVFNSLPIIASAEWALPWSFAKQYDTTISEGIDATWMNSDGMKFFSLLTAGSSFSIYNNFINAGVIATNTSSSSATVQAIEMNSSRGKFSAVIRNNTILVGAKNSYFATYGFGVKKPSSRSSTTNPSVKLWFDNNIVFGPTGQTTQTSYGIYCYSVSYCIVQSMKANNFFSLKTFAKLSSYYTSVTSLQNAYATAQSNINVEMVNAGYFTNTATKDYSLSGLAPASISAGGLDGGALNWGFSTDLDGYTRTGNGTTGWSMGALMFADNCF